LIFLNVLAFWTQLFLLSLKSILFWLIKYHEIVKSIIIEVKKGADEYKNNVQISTYECKWIQKSVLLSSCCNEFIREGKVGIINHVWYFFIFNINSITIHSVNSIRFEVSLAVFLFQVFSFLRFRWHEVNKPWIFKNNFTERYI